MEKQNAFDRLSFFILSAKKFNERIQSINRQLTPLGISYSFVFGHDVTDLGFNPPILSLNNSTILTLPELSIITKHVLAWHRGIRSGREYVLILEDDAILDPCFVQKLKIVLSQIEELKPGFLVNLGGANARVPLGFYRDKNFFYRLRMGTSEAYISDRLAMERRLSWLEKNCVDLPADHMICHIDSQVGNDHWWLKEAIVEQGSLSGAFKSRLDQGRASRNRLLLKFSYESKKFRRRTLKRWIAYVF